MDQQEFRQFTQRVKSLLNELADAFEQLGEQAATAAAQTRLPDVHELPPHPTEEDFIAWIRYNVDFDTHEKLLGHIANGARFQAIDEIGEPGNFVLRDSRVAYMVIYNYGADFAISDYV